MKIKLSDYKLEFPIFKMLVERKSEKRRLDYATEYSAASQGGLPVVVAYRFLTMIFGPDEKIEERITSILKFGDNTLEE